MQSTIEIRHQIAAITLAEELNFTRAAERLSITQSALSKRISELEQLVGFKIFERQNLRHVEITVPGQVFVRGCRDAHAILEKAIRVAKTSHDEAQPVVTIGHSPYSDPKLISALFGVHLPLYANLRLRMQTMFAPELAHAVLSSELDLAVIAEPSENPLLTQVALVTQPISVVMPLNHPATAKNVVGVEDFQNNGWIIFPRSTHPPIYDKLMYEAHMAGVAPLDIHRYVNPEEATQLIAENFGVAFMSDGIARSLRSPSVSVRPLMHASCQIQIFLVLRADESSRLINEFGRAFLRKVLPREKLEDVPKQLLLGL